MEGNVYLKDQSGNPLGTATNPLHVYYDAQIGATTLNGLSDVIITLPVEGEVLTYDATGVWKNGEGFSGYPSISGYATISGFASNAALLGGASSDTFAAAGHNHNHNDLDNIDGGTYHLDITAYGSVNGWDVAPLVHSHTYVNVSGYATISGYATLCGWATYSDAATTAEYASICAYATVCGTATDAGTLDGIDSTGFATAAHNHKLDDLSAPDDNTDLNASTSKHGLLSKLPNDATEYLNGVGTWTDAPHIDSIFRQALINGNFDVWQRGTSFDSTTTPANDDDEYLGDRWNLLSDGDDIVDVSRSTTAPDGSAYSLKMEVETANKKFGIVQILESVDAVKLAGGHVSLLFQAYTETSKAIENLRAAVISWDGTADSPPSDVVDAWGAEGTNPTLSGINSTWLTGWDYRKKIILNNTGSTLTNYQVKFTVYRSTGTDSGFNVYIGTNCETDYDDIRFTKSDGTTLLDYWIEESDSSDATIWVEVPTIAAGDTTTYLYYGNAAATAVSDGPATFPEFFDDFPGSSVDTGKWNTSGSPTVSGGICTIGGTADETISSKTSWEKGYAIRSRFRFDAENAQYGYIGFIQKSPGRYASMETGSGANKARAYTSNGTTETTQADYTPGYDVWDIIRNSTAAIYKKNGAAFATHSTYEPTDSLPAMAYTYSSTAEISIDWILVRKYADTEPTVSSYSVEQTEPSPDIFWTYENTPTNLTLVADTWTTFKIEGIVVDTVDLTNLAVFIWVDDTDAAVDDVVYISQVQICEGDVALPFQPKRYSEELRDCQRFYQALSSQTENGTRWIALPVTMRASPTLTTDTGSTANQSPDGFDLTHTASAQADITADAEL